MANSISSIVKAMQANGVATKSTKVVAPTNTHTASKKQRRCVYFASLGFGVKFHGIWDANVSASDLDPAVKVLHKNSTASEAEKLDALDYVQGLGIAFTVPKVDNAPVEQPKVDKPKADKPNTARKGQPDALAYGRDVKATKKDGGEPMSFEAWKASHVDGVVVPKADKPKAPKVGAIDKTGDWAPVNQPKADKAAAIKAAKVEAIASAVSAAVAAALSAALEEVL